MTATDDSERWRDLTLTIDQVLALGMRWLPAMSALSLLPYLVIWGLPALPDWSGIGEAAVSMLKAILIGAGIYVVSAVAHEAIHVLGMLVFARVPISSLSFGARLAEGVLFVHTDRTMTAAAYRGVLILPAVVQGLLPLAAGTVRGMGWLVIYGYVMLVSAIGDLAVLQLIRYLDANARVQDHPRKIGCRVRF